MKKKKFNSFLALLLAVTMALGQPASVYAQEVATVPTEVSDVVTETEEATTVENETEESVAEDVSTEEATTGENETEESATEEVSTEEASVEETTTEETTTEETVVEGTTEEENVTEEVTSEESTENEVTAVIEEDDQKSIKELGFKTMDLNQAMREEKAELSQVVTTMSEMKADVDYLEHQVVYFAEDEETAKQIAECYGGTLSEYEYGVAVAKIEATVKEAVNAAADLEVELPAVYPNIVYQINDDWDATANVIEEVQPTNEAVVEEEETEEEVSGIRLPCEDEQLYATAPNDTYFGKQWHHDAMNTVEAWNASKGKDVKVAVIDSGVDYTHPDLADNIAVHISVMGDGGDGRDDNGHGTHCAGIIAAVANNGKGISGIAPEAKIFSVKAMNYKGSGSTSDIIQGVRSATDAKVDVISMSLGGIYWDGAFQKVIDTATGNGIVVVAAAGNEWTSQKSYPAAYNNVIAVAATDKYNQLTDFSNYGNWVDIAAPGENILSTLPTNFTRSDVTYVSTGYGYMSGTSMACPAVAGTVALILGNNDASELKNGTSKATANKITNTLINSAVYDGAYSFYFYNYPYEDPNSRYPLVDAEASAYAVQDADVVAPEIIFDSNHLPTKNNVVLAGTEQYFELKTSTPHAKIYYTLNGKKPTAKTGILYTGKIQMDYSGKMKIQAIAVVGSKTSKVTSKTYKFDVKAEKLSSSCNEEMTVAIGKSIQLSVDFAPANTSNQKLIWSSKDADGYIKVNSKGKVSCKSNTPENHTAKIVAKTTDGTELEYEFVVKAITEKVDNVKLNKTQLYMSYWADTVTMKDLNGTYVSTFKLEPSNDGKKTDQYLYKSSNPKVAYVDDYGNITALGKGKATITVTANDGSGKKATCKVTVVTPVYDIYMWSSTGFSENSSYIPIGTGCSINMNTYVNWNYSYYLDVPSNKKLQWKSSNPEYITVSKSGKVTCGKDVVPGTTVTITATADDGFGTSQSVTFKVTDKIKKIVYVEYGTDGSVNVTNSSTLNVKGRVGSYMLDLLESPSYRDGGLKIITEHGKTYYNYFDVETTNRDVVYRNYDGYAYTYYGWDTCYIDATKPGSSKVVYKALDGSNTKFTINFKITK